MKIKHWLDFYVLGLSGALYLGATESYVLASMLGLALHEALAEFPSVTEN